MAEATAAAERRREEKERAKERAKHLAALAARGEAAWIISAQTSFPEPLSPVMNTVALEAATRWIVSVTRRSCGEEPIRRDVPSSAVFEPAVGEMDSRSAATDMEY